MYTFHYHPETKLYTGSEPCEFDALEPGRKVIPAWATDKPVPPVKDGFDRVFDEPSGYWLYSPIPVPPVEPVEPAEPVAEEE